MLNSVRELLASYNLHPKKRLGQHFLTDPGVLSRLIGAAELKAEDVVLEIGCGLGVLTAELAERVKKVIALEIDPDLILIAKEVLRSFDNINFERADFLKWKEKEKFNKVVANLPYYITTPIIEKLFTLDPLPQLIVLTVQKELAERMIAEPGGKDYGSFTVYVQNRAEVEINSYVPKSAFYPQPGVGSAILAMKPLDRPRYPISEEVVRAAFGQRRKMLRSALKKFEVDFASAGIDPRRRAETLSLLEFSVLSKHVKMRLHGGH